MANQREKATNVSKNSKRQEMNTERRHTLRYHGPHPGKKPGLQRGEIKQCHPKKKRKKRKEMERTLGIPVVPVGGIE
jgi:hypothetical protein